MPSLVWCPPGWCCGNLYLVEDLRKWRCPYSGARAPTVLTEANWLAWSEPRSMRRLFAGQQRKLDLLSDAAVSCGLGDLLEPSAQVGTHEQRKSLCDIIRDLFANPLRPLPRIDPTWITWNSGTVMRLAEAAYDNRLLPSGHLDPVRLAVLCDALLDAGCPQGHELVLHLRGEGPHVRGCAAVDALFGRA